MFIAGILLLGYQYLTQKHTLIWNKKLAFRLVILAFFNIYLTNACEVWALKHLPSAKTCLIYSLCPFASALLSFFLFSEILHYKKWMGLIVGFVGFLPIMLENVSPEDLQDSFFVFSLPELVMVIAAFSSVYGWILLKKIVTEDKISPMIANGMSMLIGGALSLAHSYFIEHEEWNPLPITNYTLFLESSLYLLIVSNFICYNLYGFLLKKYTATFMSFAGFTTPLFTAIFGWILFGETVSAYFYLSIGVIFCGLLIFKQEEIRSGQGFVVSQAQA